jgi:hypothetical protein
MGEPESKGSGFVSLVGTLKSVLPAETMDRLIAALPPETAERVRKPPLPVVWMPARQFFDVLEATARVAFAGDDEKMMDVGRRAIQGDMKTMYRMFIKLFSPGFVIERGTRLWDTYSRNFGRVHAKPIGDNACDVIYEDLPRDYMSPAYWAYQRGCVCGIIEVTGMKNVQAVVRSGGGRDGNAVIRLSWSR